ncbi:ABC transporter substrate-binding protein [Acetobacter orientalis]|uniref:ABC transporter substrate-binding protein n=1 Tax=Acetobacter orientalis TaxID=146474 RepID=UPI000A35EFE9|nr:ABC transporter substrate-binding protein [Acetobacter orientalis]
MIKRSLRACIIAFGACVVVGQAYALPRVASLNLCTDQLLLELAQPEQIVGLTPLARDCWSAVLCEQAQQAPVMRPTAENIVALHPDVVLGGVYTAAVAMQAARESGAQVLAIPPAKSLADIPVQIMQVATAIGVPERGHALVQGFERRLAALTQPRSQTDPTAAVYAANGFVTHAGTLPDDVLAHAGFRNYSTIIGQHRSAHFPMEVLIAHPPDLLILDRSGRGNSLAQSLLDHPALQEAFAGKRHLNIPARLWLCGLPQTLDSIALLKAAHRAENGPERQIP